jgi:DNA-binding transcriptional ArsR family regulator
MASQACGLTVTSDIPGWAPRHFCGAVTHTSSCQASGSRGMPANEDAQSTRVSTPWARAIGPIREQSWSVPDGVSQCTTVSSSISGCSSRYAPDRLTRLEQRLEQVMGRLAALEQSAARVPAPEPAPRAAGPAPVADGGTGAVTLPDPAPVPGPAGGEAVFSYSGRAPAGLAARKQARLSDVMNADPDSAARIFTALASPARITLLRALLHGPANSQQLRSELDDPSAGQFYHHLRELMAAGLVTQPARRLYAIPRGSEVGPVHPDRYRRRPGAGHQPLPAARAGGTRRRPARDTRREPKTRPARTTSRNLTEPRPAAVR